MPSRGRRALGLTGELLVTAGAVLGLFAVYTLVGTGVQAAQAQQVLAQQLAGGQAPAAATARPADDAVTAYARLRIPRLGADWQWVVVTGVDDVSLRAGPGHYPGSADPGEVGNVAIAGHRATYGEPFAALDAVRPGDEVQVDYRGDTFTYLVTRSYVTDPGDVDVVAAVPGRAQDEPTRALLTLTTCHPRWGSAQRLVVHGVLEEVR